MRGYRNSSLSGREPGGSERLHVYGGVCCRSVCAPACMCVYACVQGLFVCIPSIYLYMYGCVCMSVSLYVRSCAHVRTYSSCVHTRGNRMLYSFEVFGYSCVDLCVRPSVSFSLEVGQVSLV